MKEDSDLDLPNGFLPFFGMFNTPCNLFVTIYPTLTCMAEKSDSNRNSKFSSLRYFFSHDKTAQEVMEYRD